MVQKLLILLFIFISASSHANSSWIPEIEKENISYNYSQITSYDNRIRQNIINSKFVDSLIEYYTLKKIDIQNNNSLPKYVKKQRAEIYDEKIQQLNNRKKNLKTNFFKDSNFFSFEKGIYKKFSIGFTGDIGRKNSLYSQKNSFNKFNLFSKYNFYNKNNRLLTFHSGFQVEDMNDHNLIPFIAISSAEVKDLKHERKSITELFFQYFIDRQKHFISKITQSLELKNGIILQISSYAEYNKNYQVADSYFYRDQINIAKKISSTILPIVNNSIINFGLFNDFYGSKRKIYGRGFSCGIWIQL